VSWLRAHKALATIIALAIAWFIYRTAKGLAVVGGGHATPEDAVAYGWMVHQMGITGWMEISPTGETFEHTTGWTGDPFAKG